MPKLIDFVQGSEEWLEWRKWKLGASMASAIMGVSPWQTPTQLWESIVLDQGINKSFAMERGNRLEEVSRKKYNQFQSLPVNFIPACFEHDTIPWMTASLDGAIVSKYFIPIHKGNCRVESAIEIKCPGKEAHSMALNGEVPSYYLPQLMHQMVVCDLDEITYISFDGSENVAIRVKRDDEYITKKLMPALASFYQSLVDFKPPEASDKDVLEITDPIAFEMAKEYSFVIKDLERIQKRQEELKLELCSYATHGKCKIGDLRVTKVVRKGAIDYSSIPELKSVNTEKYRKEPIVSWRIS